MKIKMFLAFVLSVVLILIPSMPVSANSAQTHWQGVSALGTLIAEKDCPVVVEHELLTFNLQNFPPNYYNKEEYDYSGCVTASYTFKNPADYSVKATLAFPFGTYPSYIHEYYYNPDIADYNDKPYSDTDKYGITVNGNEVEKQLRHTYISSDYSNSDLDKIKDTYKEDAFFYPDLTVTKYSYKAQGITKENSAYASFALNADESKTKTLMQPCNGYDYHDGKPTAGTWVDNSTEIVVYAIGEPYKTAPLFTVYESGAEEKVTNGEVVLVSTETMTYEDLVFTNFEESRSISRVDWYNAILDMHIKAKEDLGRMIDFGSMFSLSRDSLMRWYIYELSFEPGETLINEVTVPIYPDIDESYEPAVYDYTYLLSPAKTWKNFGNLDVVINTPYHIVESNIEFKKDAEGVYSLSLDGLPDSELEFTLSESESPEKIKSGYFLPIEMIISFSVIAAVVAVMIIAAVLIRKKIKKKTEK